MGSSRYLGVSSCPSARQWVAELWDGCSYRLLGAFDAEEHAARAYDMACLEQHGECSGVVWCRSRSGVGGCVVEQHGEWRAAALRVLEG